MGVVMATLVTLGFIGMHQVEPDSLNHYTYDVKDSSGSVIGQKLRFRTPIPKFEFEGLIFEHKGAFDLLTEALGPPFRSQLDELVWLFAFDDEPSTGFQITVKENRFVVIREWTVRTFRYWTPPQAEPATRGFVGWVNGILDDGAKKRPEWEW